jgi:acyl-CoA thioester hydrolase
MPPEWPFRFTLPVRFRDLDPMGHVNHAVYVTYFEEARSACYLGLLGRADPIEPGHGLDFVVARLELDYVDSVRHGDVLTVTMWPDHVGRSSFAFAYEATRQDGAVMARARTVLVAFDHAAQRKVDVSPLLRARLESGLRKPS